MNEKEEDYFLGWSQLNVIRRKKMDVYITMRIVETFLSYMCMVTLASNVIKQLKSFNLF